MHLTLLLRSKLYSIPIHNGKLVSERVEIMEVHMHNEVKVGSGVYFKVCF